MNGVEFGAKATRTTHGAASRHGGRGTPNSGSREITSDHLLILIKPVLLQPRGPGLTQSSLQWWM